MSTTTIKGLITVAATAMAFATVGCTTQGEDTVADPFPEGTGQAAPAPEAYPDVPTGFGEGAIIPNLEFVGYANFMDPANEGVQVVKLSDFYNPTGDGMFPEGSPYGSLTPKPRAINMLISSSWCPPCQMEAAQILPGEYAHYKPIGGHFLGVLIDGPTPGTPAHFGNLTAWSSQYSTNYSMVIDPSSQAMQWYEPAFPGNMIIRTSDMKIIRVVAGVPDEAFWATFDEVLNGTYQE